MKTAYLTFSAQGEALAHALAAQTGGEVSRAPRDAGLAGWTRDHFASDDALVFVGAAGIAVRAIAPYVASKSSDPAVIVIDETGHYVIPVLSGHLGGANDLAVRLSRLCGGEAVLTTATDRHGLFAVDSWARHQNCRIVNPAMIKHVSSGLLEGKDVTLESEWEISGEVPAQVRVRYTAGQEKTDRGDHTPDGFRETALSEEEDRSCRIRLSLHPSASRASLNLVPAILVLGIGCRRGTGGDQIEAFFQAFLEKHQFRADQIVRVCSLDRKADEAGILAFCGRHGYPFVTYSAEELMQVPGQFSASAYVLGQTGTDNVCERSAVKGSGGMLLCGKEALGGITMALAACPFAPDWRWTDE